jgi:hypothetical protein
VEVASNVEGKQNTWNIHVEGHHKPEQYAGYREIVLLYYRRDFMGG